MINFFRDSQEKKTALRKMRSSTFLKIAISWFVLAPASLIAAQNQRAASQAAATDSLDSTAIRATYDGVLVDSNNHILFYYVFKNQSTKEYKALDGKGITLAARIAGRRPKLQTLSEREFKIIYPIVIGAGLQQIVVMRDLRQNYDFPLHLKENPTAKEYATYEKELQKFIDRHWPGYDGFVLDDAPRHIRISMTKGWGPAARVTERKKSPQR